MTPAISVLFPTIRPSKAQRALACLELACGDVPFEVIVVADFSPGLLGELAPCPHLRWIRRERRGVIDAIQVAYQDARGEYVFLFNDESTLEPGALQRLYAAATTDAIVTVRHEPPFRFEYYGRPFAPFPFAHRDLIQRLGGFLDPAFGAFYADPDFSLRAHAAGVPIHVVPNAVLYHCNDHDDAHRANVARYLDADRATFRARWDHLGAFQDPE